MFQVASLGITGMLKEKFVSWYQKWQGIENGQSNWAHLIWLQVVSSVPICRTFFMRLRSTKPAKWQSLTFQLTQPSAAFLWKKQWGNCCKSKATKCNSDTDTKPHFIYTKQIYLVDFPRITRHSDDFQRLQILIKHCIRSTTKKTPLF